MDATYHPASDRYDTMPYRRCGASGLSLPVLSLGLWHNFGDDTPHATKQAICRKAFDLGINHFDLANVYGPTRGRTESAFADIIRSDFAGLRDELVIATKAGYDMWTGPTGQGCSRKHLVSACDGSLRRLGLDYVDIFYAHRYDSETPVEETAAALDFIVRSGRAHYIGISSYSARVAQELTDVLNMLGTPCIVNQPSYNMFNRWIETEGLLDQAGQAGTGIVAFTPLCQGLLTGKYLGGVTPDSRAAKGDTLTGDEISEDVLAAVQALNEIAQNRGQSLAQMALSWSLRDQRVTSVIIGASRPDQVAENAIATRKLDFSEQELERIDDLTRGIYINPWQEAVEN